MGRKSNLSKEQIQNMCRLYKEGKSSVELGNIFNKTPSSIVGYLKRNGIETRSNKQNSRKYYHDENYFKKIDSEEKAYWLGFIYADGFINAKHKSSSQSFGITLSSEDIDHLKKFKKCISSNNPINSYKASDNNYSLNTIYSRIVITSQKTVDDLKNKGVLEHKTDILVFPTSKQVPNKFIKDFIRGYNDGDGCISYTDTDIHKNEYSIKILGTEEFLDGIKHFIEKNKITKINRYYKRKEFQEVSSLEFSGNKQVKKFLDLIYKDATMYLDRKYERYINLCNYYK